uniref:PKD domain-containing protein n=1 Tax=Brumimicrobium mesophilum TaxID=392717 RepID=UPI00131D69DD
APPCNSPCNMNATFGVSASGTNTFTFTPSTILPANTYFWMFGDGTTSNNPIVTHTYSTASTYPVMLMVSDSLCSDIDTVYIDVLDSSAYNLNSSFTYTQGNNGLYNFVANNDVISYDSFIWDFGDNTTSTALAPNHTFPSNGNYLIQLTVFDGIFTQTDSLNLTVGPLGISSNSKSKFEAKLFPNPATDILNLEFTMDISENIEITLIDLNGKILNQESFTANAGKNTKKMNIDSISKGVYQVILRKENGDTLERMRLVKQ